MLDDTMKKLDIWKKIKGRGDLLGVYVSWTNSVNPNFLWS